MFSVHIYCTEACISISNDMKNIEDLACGLQMLGRSFVVCMWFSLCIMFVYVNVLLLLCEANDVNILLDHGGLW